jgi:hypothetical protein
MSRRARRFVIGSQAAYYVTTGVWPFVHLRSFLYVTGPKWEVWLVKTVGALVTVIGSVLGWAAARDRLTPELEALSAGTAGALGAIDVWYVARGRIAPTYLDDAAAEAGIIAGLAAARRRRGRWALR